jgi:hypothetical protein
MSISLPVQGEGLTNAISVAFLVYVNPAAELAAAIYRSSCPVRKLAAGNP